MPELTQTVTDGWRRQFREFGLPTATRELPEQQFCALFLQWAYLDGTFELPNADPARQEEGDRVWKGVVEPHDFISLGRLEVVNDDQSRHFTERLGKLTGAALEGVIDRPAQCTGSAVDVANCVGEFLYTRWC